MGGELFQFIDETGPFSAPMCRFFIKQILQGVHFLHRNGYAHRDLKPENILLDKDFNVKIVDFGFAQKLDSGVGSALMKGYKGTLPYMAPEIIAKKNYQG